MSALDDLRSSQARDFGAEGIPMVLALVDETVAQGNADAEPSEATSGLVRRLDELRATLAPDQRDGDLGVTATLLALAAWAEVRDGRAAGEH